MSSPPLIHLCPACDTLPQALSCLLLPVISLRPQCR
jgi:hypothetical protein